MLRFDVLTLFPELFRVVMGESIIGRAQKKGIIEINPVNIRDFSTDKHRKVDDYPYGGGKGMVMMAQPIYDAYLHLIKSLDYKPRVIYMSPQGKVLTQEKAIELASYNHIILLCGHYEGVDERVLEEIVDEEISIGDYVLTGGELPAMVLIDCVSRLVPGVLSDENSFKEDSLYDGLLEYPQYTRPYIFNEKKVPDVLLSGHHAKIERWRKLQSIVRTYYKRPELLKDRNISPEDIRSFEEELRNME